MNSSDKQEQLAQALKEFQDKRSRSRTPLAVVGDGTAETLKKLRKELLDFGITYSQDVHTARSNVGTSTRLMHTSGEWMESQPFYLPARNGTLRATRVTASLSLLGILGLITVEEMPANDPPEAAL